MTDYINSNSVENEGEVEFYSAAGNDDDNNNKQESTSLTGIVLGVIAAVFAVTVVIAFFAYRRVRRFRLESDWKENVKFRKLQLDFLP